MPLSSCCIEGCSRCLFSFLCLPLPPPPPPPLPLSHFLFAVALDFVLGILSSPNLGSFGTRQDSTFLLQQWTWSPWLRPRSVSRVYPLLDKVICLEVGRESKMTQLNGLCGGYQRSRWVRPVACALRDVTWWEEAGQKSDGSGSSTCVLGSGVRALYSQGCGSAGCSLLYSRSAWLTV